MADIANVLRIDDPEVDVDAIVARIRKNLADREPIDVDVSALLKRFGADLNRPSVQDLDLAIGTLRLLLDNPIPSQRIRPAHGSVGRFLNRLRRPLHDIVRFYVDPHASRQTEMAWLILDALVAVRAREEVLRAESGSAFALGVRLEALARDAEAMRAELAALRQEVAELRENRASADR